MARSELAPRSAGILGTAIQLVMLLLLLAILGAVVLVLFSIASIANVPSQLGGGVSAQAGHALSSAQQAVQNVTDPNHPPTGLSYDTEFTALETWRVGDGLPGGTDYVLTVKSIERRAGNSPETALYVVVHAELRQPHQTRILGQLVRSDSDPHDYVVYKGETFRVGQAVYRVNWISQETRSLAAGVLRTPDTMTQQLKFDYP